MVPESIGFKGSRLTKFDPGLRCRGILGLGIPCQPCTMRSHDFEALKPWVQIIFLISRPEGL